MVNHVTLKQTSFRITQNEQNFSKTGPIQQNDPKTTGSKLNPQEIHPTRSTNTERWRDQRQQHTANTRGTVSFNTHQKDHTPAVTNACMHRSRDSDGVKVWIDSLPERRSRQPRWSAGPPALADPEGREGSGAGEPSPLPKQNLVNPARTTTGDSPKSPSLRYQPLSSLPSPLSRGRNWLNQFVGRAQLNKTHREEEASVSIASLTF
jgi:hypothetical protein